MPPSDPSAKYSSSPIFVQIINELNINADQLQKRQRLISQIEELLTARYRTANRVMSYMFRFGVVGYFQLFSP